MDEIPELTVAEVAARIGSAGFHVFDCNGAGRYGRSHVPTAMHVNPHSFPIEVLPADRHATLLFYCSGPG
jgi:hypothetical protein